MLARPNCEPPNLAAHRAVAALLAQKQAITNWDNVTSSLGLTGWNSSVPVCEWYGIACSESGAIISL